MALDRDETILRLAVADMASPQMPIARGGEAAWADGIVARGDALLARLRPEAVAPAPSRPEWVRIKGGRGWYPPFVRKVVRWDGDNPAVHTAHGNGCDLLTEEDPITVEPGDWEPCAAPSPAASPAPKVDREGLIAFIRRERIKWAGNSDTRKIDEVSADAALAYLKANGGVA